MGRPSLNSAPSRVVPHQPRGQDVLAVGTPARAGAGRPRRGPLAGGADGHLDCIGVPAAHDGPHPVAVLRQEDHAARDRVGKRVAHGGLVSLGRQHGHDLRVQGDAVALADAPDRGELGALAPPGERNWSQPAGERAGEPRAGARMVAGGPGRWKGHTGPMFGRVEAEPSGTAEPRRHALVAQRTVPERRRVGPGADRAFGRWRAALGTRGRRVVGRVVAGRRSPARTPCACPCASRPRGAAEGRAREEPVLAVVLRPTVRIQEDVAGGIDACHARRRTAHVGDVRMRLLGCMSVGDPDLRSIGRRGETELQVDVESGQADHGQGDCRGNGGHSVWRRRAARVSRRVAGEGVAGSREQALDDALTRSRSQDLAERVGFEPTGPRGPAVFKTAPIDRSGTSPRPLADAILPPGGGSRVPRDPSTCSSPAWSGQRGVASVAGPATGTQASRSVAGSATEPPSGTSAATTRRIPAGTPTTLSVPWASPVRLLGHGRKAAVGSTASAGWVESVRTRIDGGAAGGSAGRSGAVETGSGTRPIATSPAASACMTDTVAAPDEDGTGGPATGADAEVGAGETRLPSRRSGTWSCVSIAPPSAEE